MYLCLKVDFLGFPTLPPLSAHRPFASWILHEDKWGKHQRLMDNTLYMVKISPRNNAWFLSHTQVKAHLFLKWVVQKQAHASQITRFWLKVQHSLGSAAGLLSHLSWKQSRFTPQIAIIKENDWRLPQHLPGSQFLLSLTNVSSILVLLKPSILFTQIHHRKQIPERSQSAEQLQKDRLWENPCTKLVCLCTLRHILQAEICWVRFCWVIPLWFNCSLLQNMPQTSQFSNAFKSQQTLKLDLAYVAVKFNGIQRHALKWNFQGRRYIGIDRW